MRNVLDDLVGHRVIQLNVEPDGSRLIFVTPYTKIAWQVEGDCCSHSYFHDILGVDTLLGHVVTAVDLVDVPDNDWNDNDERCHYGIRLTTERGYADIIYRNESNGYYGGYCEPTADTSLDGTKKVTEDWTL